MSKDEISSPREYQRLAVSHGLKVPAGEALVHDASHRKPITEAGNGSAQIKAAHP